MTDYLPQNINRPLSHRLAIVTTGGLVASPFTGAVNTAVLLFANLGTVSGPTTEMVSDNDGDDGTSIAIVKPGVYQVRLYLEADEPIDVRVGISQDVAAGGLTAEPSFATAGMLDVQRFTTLANLANAMCLSRNVIVSPEQSLAGVGSLIRFHATLVGGAAPAGAFVQAAAYYTIVRNNQAHS